MAAWVVVAAAAMAPSIVDMGAAVAVVMGTLRMAPEAEVMVIGAAVIVVK